MMIEEIEKLVSLKSADIHQKEHVVLKNIDFEVLKGEFVYLVGKVGSGKSSLLKTLYGEIPLESGDGEVVGYNLKKLRKKDIPYLRRKIGIVFQDFRLLEDRSIYKNLEFVLKATNWKGKDKIDARINEALQHVGMANKGYKMPHELSGGEQQRVAIARALLNFPDLILADEPTGNLDPETAFSVMELLFNLKNEGKSVIMATHNYTIVDHFHGRILRCEDDILQEQI